MHAADIWKDYGAGDYIAVTKAFHTIVLADVPRLSLFQKNAARRFITFLDAVYEHKACMA